MQCLYMNTRQKISERHAKNIWKFTSEFIDYGQFKKNNRSLEIILRVECLIVMDEDLNLDG